MSTRINTNTTAFMASQNLSANSDKLSTDIQRLSTGLRINSASDDASGLVISQNMNAQIVGLQQATSNTNNAVNVVKTAEGALNEVQSLLMSMRQLAVHASNLGVNSAADVSADQAQIASAIQSIDRISSTTQFGTKKLLDGSATSAATTTAGSSSVAGTGLSVISQGSWTSATAGAYTTATVTAATASTVTATASAAPTSYGGSAVINGTTYAIGAGSTLAQLNTVIGGSGYTAALSGTTLTLTSAATGAPASAQSANLTGLTGNGGITFAAGTTTQGTAASLALTGAAGTINSVGTVSNGSAGNTFSFANGLTASSATTTGVIAATTLTSVAGTSTTGTTLQFQVGANGGQTTSQDIQSTSSDQLGKGAASYTDATGAAQTVYTDSIKNLNVTTFKGSQDAIAVIDKAISDISTVRANLGAFQSNVLESNARSLGVAQQNLSASKSTITDTDLASTIVDYTKNQILVQSATTALSYANQMPQSILKLLQ